MIKSKYRIEICRKDVLEEKLINVFDETTSERLDNVMGTVKQAILGDMTHWNL